MFASFVFILSLVGLSFRSSLWHEMAPIICLFKVMMKKKNTQNQVNNPHADNAFFISFGLCVFRWCYLQLSQFNNMAVVLLHLFFHESFSLILRLQTAYSRIAANDFRTNENGILIDLYVASIIGYKLKKKITRSQFTWWLKWSAEINIAINFKWNECF